MSNENLQKWIGRIGSKHGFTSSDSAAAGTGQTCAETRPPEVIAGASGVQTSDGENTYETLEEGTDFATGSRQNATENDHDQAGSGYAEGSNPMQSPDLGSHPFALRYGIGFLCSEYRDSPDLADIAELSSPTSAYLRAFRGMDRKRQYENPTSAQIVSRIGEWVQRLGGDLEGCDQGELVVSFQGHGENGSIFGVDEREITASQLLSIGRSAARSRVSITYVLDACFTGNAVAGFQDNAADHVERNIDATEGAGSVSSLENDDRARALRDRMAHARELVQMSEAVGRQGRTLQAHVDDIEADPQDTGAWDFAMATNAEIVRSITAMRHQFRSNMDFGSDPAMGLPRAERAFDEILSFLSGIRPGTSFDYALWTSRIGRFQDTVSDVANTIIGVLDRQARAAG